MDDILTQLYDLYAESERYPEDSPAGALSRRITALEEPLCETFGVKYMNTLADAQGELEELYQKNAFLNGFFCGVELMGAIHAGRHHAEGTGDGRSAPQSKSLPCVKGGGTAKP